MCMGGPGCMGSNKKLGNTYSPKKSSAKASKGSYTPSGRAATMSSFGKPSVRMSFSGKK